jgi:hypothetical protein
MCGLLTFWEVLMKLGMVKKAEKRYLYSFLTKSLVAGMVSSCSLSNGTEWIW